MWREPKVGSAEIEKRMMHQQTLVITKFIVRSAFGEMWRTTNCFLRMGESRDLFIHAMRSYDPMFITRKMGILIWIR
jgi:hypothetical protein